jgi:branched-chain amino acid transport system ATP-binding protein
LLLDEVLAGLNPAEIEEMLKLLRTLKAQGLTLLLVEHVMRVIIGIAERGRGLELWKEDCRGKPPGDYFPS